MCFFIQKNNKTHEYLLNHQIGVSKRKDKENLENARMLTVRIDDINDNSPVFPSNLEPVSVGEESSVGTVVSISQYIAFDNDCGELNLRLVKIVLELL